MKKANMKLDLVNDKAELFGNIKLENTFSVNYGVHISNIQSPKKEHFLPIKMFTKKKEIMIKLQKQSGHLMTAYLKALLSEAGILDNDCNTYY